MKLTEHMNFSLEVVEVNAGFFPECERDWLCINLQTAIPYATWLCYKTLEILFVFLKIAYDISRASLDNWKVIAVGFSRPSGGQHSQNLEMFMDWKKQNKDMSAMLGYNVFMYSTHALLRDYICPTYGWLYVVIYPSFACSIFAPVNRKN